MGDKREVIDREDGLFPGLAVLAWMFGPVHWVVQANPGLTEVNLNTHLMAWKQYGFHFIFAVGGFSILYLSFPHLWRRGVKLCRQFRERYTSLPGRVENDPRKIS